MTREPNLNLAGLVACLIRQADWWTQTLKGPGFHLHFRPIIHKTYPGQRQICRRLAS